MKAFGQSGKRFFGGILVCGCVAFSCLTPLAAHAASPGSLTTQRTTTLSSIPKRCRYIENELSNLSPADFLNQQAFIAAVRALMAELHACEAKG
jgi:hypothetical protein